MKKLLKRLIPETSAPFLAYHRTRAFFAAVVHGFPARKLTIIGITGTDGKTTTVGMTAHILNMTEKKCGALSTAFFQIGHSVTWNPTQKTSHRTHDNDGRVRRIFPYVSLCVCLQ
jgi:UDP-N-acetylmuramyl tripeptide synthase